MNSKRNLINSLYRKSLFPNVLAVLGGTVNVLVDGILVGRRLGEVGLTVINQSLAIYLLLCTIGSLIAGGASAKSAIAMGNNEPDKAQRYYSSGLFTAICIAVVFTLTGLIFMNPICRLLSTDETFADLKTYVTVTLAGGIFKVLLYIPFCYLRLEGKNKQSAVSMTVMMILNIVLDALFLFVFDMGIFGAAIASVTATAVACLVGFIFLHTGHTDFKLGLSFPNIKDFFSVCRYGAPMAFNNLLAAGRILLLNIIFNRFAPEGSGVLYAVTNSINEFLLCVQGGVPQTAVAMMGIFYGEKDNKALSDIVGIQLKWGLMAAGIASVMLVVFHKLVLTLYGCSQVNLFCFICYAVSFVIGMVNSILFYCHTATGKTMPANLNVFCRTLFFAVIFCFAFSGSNLIWLFYPLSELFALCTVCLASLILGRKKKLNGLLLLDPAWDNGNSVSYEVDCNNEAICNASNAVRDFCDENEFMPKRTMAVSLAIEEILGIINNKSLEGKGSMSLRVLSVGDDCIIRIRAGGKRYNPVEMNDDSLDYLGVTMITKMAKKIDYQSSLGLNTLIIYI